MNNFLDPYFVFKFIYAKEIIIYNRLINSEFNFTRFDVAVLKLDRPVHYMPHIAPICLPEKNEDFLGQYGWAAGWGALQAGNVKTNHFELAKI